MKIELIKKLDELRTEKRSADETYKTVEAEFLEENNWVIETRKVLALEISETEVEIRKLAVQEYMETKEKKLAFGIGIRVVKKLDYDNEQALNWAKHHELALALDKKAFEKIVKVDPPSFVEISEEAQATIPRELKL